ncbi:hypothetical protein D9M72_586230 [compost metagenome]
MRIHRTETNHNHVGAMSQFFTGDQKGLGFDQWRVAEDNQQIVKAAFNCFACG